MLHDQSLLCNCFWPLVRWTQNSAATSFLLNHTSTDIWFGTAHHFQTPITISWCTHELIWQNQVLIWNPIRHNKVVNGKTYLKYHKCNYIMSAQTNFNNHANDTNSQCSLFITTKKCTRILRNLIITRIISFIYHTKTTVFYS